MVLCYYNLATPGSIYFGNLTEQFLTDSNSRTLCVKSFVSWCRNFGMKESNAGRFSFEIKMANKIKYPVVNGLKECGVCRKWKAIIEYDKARNHYTSACKECRKEYAAQYRQRPEVKLIQASYAKEYVARNRARVNERGRNRNKLPHVKAQRNAQRREWAAREKRKAVDYKGGECSLCGYSKCLAALDFHHRNPAEKEGYGAGGALVSHWTFERNRAELDKCVLVCVRCHREIHAGLHRGLLNG